LAGSAATGALNKITQNRRAFANLIGYGLFFLKKRAYFLKKLRLTVQKPFILCKYQKGVDKTNFLAYTVTRKQQRRCELAWSSQRFMF